MKILYFGIYNPDFGRNKVYISGLKKNGHEVIECRDTSPGIMKFWRLWGKHRFIVKNALKGQKKPYDAMVIGYPGHIVVPFAKLISRAPVVFDALCTLYEGQVLSRGWYKHNPFMLFWINLIDWLAVKCADLVLVETEAQKEFFVKRFSVVPKKVVRIFTGADTEFLYPDKTVSKNSQFTAIFRGKFLPEAGVEYILDSAKILENAGVFFTIIGNGLLDKEIKAKISDLGLKNLELISEQLSWDEIRKKMLESHVSLGQFGNHERLGRTIPHKAFEALALGMPYITGRAGGANEIFVDRENCLMTNCADAKDLAEKILMLKNDLALAAKISENGRKFFLEKLTPEKLAAQITSAILSI
jgi:glycosyltransferase involved in cell wall biosynthesis